MNKLTFLLFCTFVLVGCNSFTADEVIYEVIYAENTEEDKEVQMDTKREFTIAVVPKLVNIPYFNSVEQGVMEAAKEFGVHVIYEGPTITEPNKQIKIVEELIEQKVDVIAISANDPNELAPVLIEAKKQGVKVITWDSDTVPGVREFFVNMVHPETLGRHLMDTLAWNVDEEGDFAIMTGSLSAANLNEWLSWIKVQQEQYYPNMNLVEIAATDDDPHKAFIVATQLLSTYPNLKGIIGNSSVGPPAAAQAVKEAGKVGEVSVVGLSSPNPMNEYLKDGSAQIVTLWSPKKLGYLTVVLAKNLLKDLYPYDGQEIAGVGKIRVINDMVIMGEPIDFTKENVDQYDF